MKSRTDHRGVWSSVDGTIWELIKPSDEWVKRAQRRAKSADERRVAGQAKKAKKDKAKKDIKKLAKKDEVAALVVDLLGLDDDA